VAVVAVGLAAAVGAVAVVTVVAAVAAATVRPAGNTGQWVDSKRLREHRVIEFPRGAYFCLFPLVDNPSWIAG
jgi:hypothetical protein